MGLARGPDLAEPGAVAIQELSVKHGFDLREADPSLVHVDVRPAAAFAAGRPRGSRSVPLQAGDPAGFVAAVRGLSAPERRLIVSGSGQGEARRACEALSAAGYAHLVLLVGGLEGSPDQPGWRAFGLPLDAGEVAG